MIVEKKDGKLIITLEMNSKPTLSATGKTLSVASSHGNQPTTVTVDGKVLRVGVNAYIAAK